MNALLASATPHQRPLPFEVQPSPELSHPTALRAQDARDPGTLNEAGARSSIEPAGAVNWSG
jgi:hypothetical protein